MSAFDYIVLAVYFAITLAIGLWSMRRSRESDSFMVARGRLGGWVVGLSIFGTYVSSISFLAVPGRAFISDWNSFVFSLSLPIVARIGAELFVPYYRRIGQVSAYEHLEERFGVWARLYMSACYMLVQVARVGSVMYLMALVLQQLLGWDMVTVIIVTGIATTIYTCIGGLEGVVLTDALQSVVLIAGTVLCAIWLPLAMPEGPEQVFAIAAENDKFSLGSWGIDLRNPTVWVVLIYSLTVNVKNVAIDQSYTQRYLAASSEKEAKKSVWFGSLLYVPVSACFFFIGTCLYAYYTAQPSLLSADLTAEWVKGKGDGVFPYFIVSTLPAGVRGLLLAAILAAAMSTISSGLNSSATLTLSDFYKRLINREPTERQAMTVLYAGSALWGAAGIGLALAMIQVKSVLDLWWEMSGVISGGMLGLFLLSYLSPKVGSRAAVTGVVAGVIVIAWLTFSPEAAFLPPALRNPLHPFLTVVVGTASITLTGFAAVMLWGRRGTGDSAKG